MKLDACLQEAQQIDRVARRLDGRTSSQWSQIQQELRYISNVYGFGYGGYGRDDDWRRNDDGVATATVTATTATTIGGDESHSLGNSPHLNFCS